MGKTSTIVSAEEAIKKSQEANRKNWLKSAGDKLSKKILDVASTGVREICINFNDLIIGSENLFEAGEMLAYIDDQLKAQGYKNVIEKTGVLHISW